MNRQRGFIQLPLLGWAAIAAGAAILLLGFALKVQTDRLRAVQAEYGQFKGGVEALGAAAADAAAKKEKDDRERKEKADAENLKTIAALRADVKRLRDARSGSSFVPGPAAGASRPDLACFDRAELESALRRFDQELQGIVDEGSAATVDLNTAKVWAQSP